MAEDASQQIQINALKTKMAEFLEDPLLKSLEISEWVQLFEYFAQHINQLQTYMALGGIPEYLLKATDYSTFDEFLPLKFYSKGNPRGGESEKRHLRD